ncbi:ATP-binding protein [Micromonospora sp. CPCC 206061]|uniref:ATP-binding protein n=1 Tax=Micromonospora sp. CPCC 206061 TaxID=3122410 RepID=UPI002FF2369D
MFGRLLRGHRRRHGWTQEDMAAKAGLSVRAIGKLEAGRIAAPRPQTVNLLAAALGLTGADRDEFLAAATLSVDQPPAAGAPAQLPPDVSAFAGREAQLARLDALLDGPTGRAVAVAVLSGTPGVGKTALAIHWAHRAARHFPDGQLYVNLRGFDPGGRLTPPTEAVRGLLDALGVPPDAVPAGLDSQVGLYRSRVAGKRMLIVLDNARDADQIRPLLPGTPSAVVVVTSRDRLTGLVAGVGAEPVMLDPLSTVESRDLLAQRLGPDQVAGDPDAVSRIIAACARLPLALTIAAARVRQSGFALHDVADELNEAGQRLDVLDTADRTSQVRAVFSWSYASLSPPAARLFRLLGLHPGPEVSVPAAASLAGHPPSAIRPLLLELVQANLLAEQAPGRYVRHDLLGVYAAERCRVEDGDGERATAVRRMLDHYTHSAYHADRVVYPLRDPIRLALDPPAPGTTPERPASEDQALAWFDTEHAVLLAVQRRAAEDGFDVPVLQLAWALRTFHVYRGHRAAMATVWRTAIPAARRIGRLDEEAEAHRCVGLAATYVDDHAEALANYQRALRLFAEAGDDVGQGYTHQSLALLGERRDDPRGALHHAERAVAGFRSGGHDRGRAKALNAVGWYHALLGEHDQALVHCEQALALLERFADPYGQAHTWDSLGYIHHRAGHADRAVECYQRAVALFDEVGDRGDGALTLVRLGDSHEAAGDREAAVAAWRQALDVFTALGHPEATAVAAKLALPPP